MKVVITGAGGQLGQELQATAPSEAAISACDHARLDITQREQVERVLRDTAPDLVINAAAFTAVDRAEEQPEAARTVNADGAHTLAQAVSAGAARLIHLSTDFVFDGSSSQPYLPDADPNPQSVYGSSKWQGERYVLEATDEQALIVRTAWLYSRFGHNFVTTVLRRLADRRELAVVADQVGSPTWARGLAAALWRAAEQPAMRGIHHWTDAGVASWYDFAVAIQEEARALGLLESDCVVQPVGTDDYPTAARRPAYSVLDKRATWRALNLTPPHWRVQLRSMLRDLKERHSG